MAIVAQFKVEGMSVGQYETVLRQLESAGAGAPQGRLYHLSFGDPANLQVIDVYDSQQSLDNFAETLVPILQKLGIKATPEISPVHRIIKG